MSAKKQRARREGLHRWTRTGFGRWKCSRRGCGLKRKDAHDGRSRDGWLYQRPGKGGSIWKAVQDLPDGKTPLCRGGVA